MQKLQILSERIAQAQASTKIHHQGKIKDRTGSTQELELDRASETNPTYSFIVCVAASTLIITFGLFCFTVRTFPGGSLRIEGPWGVRVEAQLGPSVIPEKAVPPQSR